MLGIRHRNKNKRRRLHIACCRLFCLLNGSKPPSLRNPNSHCHPQRPPLTLSAKHNLYARLTASRNRITTR